MQIIKIVVVVVVVVVVVPAFAVSVGEKFIIKIRKGEMQL